MEIPFFDLKRQYHQIRDEIDAAIKQVLDSAAFSGGFFVEKFEREFANYCGAKHCVAVNSGTSALHVALLALGLGRGDEVIIPSATFIASTAAISHVGATPVFVDCDPLTWNMDGGLIQKKVTSKTKAILGVHLYGQPFDVESVEKIVLQNSLFLLEDCAQAHGAEFRGKRVGTFGKAGCFSFYPGKNLGGYGEGGAVVTGDGELASRIRALRDHGSKEKYYHEEIGFNMRMDGFQGAILSVKLKHLAAWNKKRELIAKAYRERFRNEKIRLQTCPSWARSVYHLFVVVTKNRNHLKDHLKSKGISTALHYPVPCHLQKSYAGLGYTCGDLPNSEFLADHCLTLPMYPELKEEEIDWVIEGVNSYKGVS